MGQGRNTIYLAQQGWDSVGFDPADRAVAAAQEQATKLGVKITTHITHRDVTKTRPIGAAVVSDTNELLRLFAPLRVVRYEDTDALSDFERFDTRVVRLAAIKP
jgi:hypothetical protein